MDVEQKLNLIMPLSLSFFPSILYPLELFPGIANYNKIPFGLYGRWKNDLALAPASIWGTEVQMFAAWCPGQVIN